MSRVDICFLIATIGHTAFTTDITFEALYKKAMYIMDNSPEFMGKSQTAKRRRTSMAPTSMWRLPGYVRGRPVIVEKHSLAALCWSQ